MGHRCVVYLVGTLILHVNPADRLEIKTKALCIDVRATPHGASERSHVVRRRTYVSFLFQAWQYIAGSSCLIPRHSRFTCSSGYCVCNAPYTPTVVPSCSHENVRGISRFPDWSMGEKSEEAKTEVLAPLPPSLPPRPLPTCDSLHVPRGPPFSEKGGSYFVVPEQCFSLALPEFHVLCASGAVGDDRRALDGALSKLSSVSDRGCCVRVRACMCVWMATNTDAAHVVLVAST